MSARLARGLATVEAVVTLPLLLLLLLAGVEIGRTFVQYTTLANAVRQAARLVASDALLGTTQTIFLSPTLITRARNVVVYGNEAGTGSPRLPRLAAGQVTIRDAGGNNVEVSVTYPYEPMFGPTLRTFGAGTGSVPTAYNMRIDVTMRAI
jgi:Flp pilus assembly protein TadG